MFLRAVFEQCIRYSQPSINAKVTPKPPAHRHHHRVALAVRLLIRGVVHGGTSAENFVATCMAQKLVQINQAYRGAQSRRAL